MEFNQRIWYHSCGGVGRCKGCDPVGVSAMRRWSCLFGVDDHYLLADAHKNARLGIYYFESGASPRKPSVVYDRSHSSMTKLVPTDFSDELMQSTRCFHTTGITLALGGTVRDTAVDLMHRCKQAGVLTSFDVNFRANLWDETQARDCIQQILPDVDVFFCSELIARLTFQKQGTLQEMMKSFAKEYDIAIVCSTKRTVHSPKSHSFSSIIYNYAEDRFYEETAYEQIDVVDCIGSGDCYIAGVLYGLLHHDMDCNQALYYGNACSAVKKTVLGDLPATNLREIDAIIAEHHSNAPKSEMNR